MSNAASLRFDSRWVLAQRGPKNSVTPWRPSSYWIEAERTEEGGVEDVATLLLTNRECPFHCLMCDHWRNTLDETVPAGAIATQIRWALAHLPPASSIKLYNSGSFFDPRAIPPADLPEIADLLTSFRSVIVESHPHFVTERCLTFAELLKPNLQVAIGLETVHPEVLRRLNKRMTLDDFARAVAFLLQHDIQVRAFVLLRPPFLDEAEGILWARRSLDFAFQVGVECCVVIPTRGEHGPLRRLAELGMFSPPRLDSLEEVVEYGIGLKRGRVFADLWDIDALSTCRACFDRRVRRLRRMNLTQEITPTIACECREVL